MKEKMPKKSGRWWFWRKSSVKQVWLVLESRTSICLLAGVCVVKGSRQIRNRVPKFPHNHYTTNTPLAYHVLAFYPMFLVEVANIASSLQSSSETKLERQESLTRESPALHPAPETQ